MFVLSKVCVMKDKLSTIELTVRPKKLLRRKRFNATEMKHVPRSMINDRSALFGNGLSSLGIGVELLFETNNGEDEDCFADIQL